MDLTPYVNQLREDLTTAASAGDEQTRHTAAMLGVALAPAARLAIMNALSDLAAEVTAALDDRVV
ncbi:MAG: toxin-antitoxin system HicB family antitoxin, partial [Pseudonocardiaceae bacterium]